MTSCANSSTYSGIIFNILFFQFFLKDYKFFQVNGCNGGNSLWAYWYANNGLATATSYPFTNASENNDITGTCTFNSATMQPLYYPKSFLYAQASSDQAVIELLVKYGPLSIAIDASEPVFNLYSSGYYADSIGDCTTNTG